MITWVLILFAHVGAMGNGNSNALTNVPGFTSLQQCRTAGDAAQHLADGTTKEIRYTCVVQGNP